jgi:hypothetical protein
MSHKRIYGEPRSHRATRVGCPLEPRAAPNGAGALPSGVNAVLDALASRGRINPDLELDLPFSPARVWQALQR